MPTLSSLPRRATRLLAFTLAVIGALDAQTIAAQTPTRTAPLEVATLGSCRLTSGAIIATCRVAYRRYGHLATARDNVVLIPTFFAGKSEDHLFMLGAYVDTTRYHVVIVDALADGHSSSPSNSADGAVPFAALTVGDMVDAQHRLLTEHLSITHLRAVVGISMGGFQAFEWAVRHPRFMDAAVSIVGSPRLTTFDRLIFDTWRASVEDMVGAGAATEFVWRQASRLEALRMRTPRFLNDSGGAHLARSINEVAVAYRDTWSPADYAAQLRAMAAHDISAPFGSDMTRAASAVQARMLVVWTPDDQLIDPRPGAAFARLVGADTLAVRSDCGHAVFWCEPDRIGRVVRGFMSSSALAGTNRKPNGRRGATP